VWIHPYASGGFEVAGIDRVVVDDRINVGPTISAGNNRREDRACRDIGGRPSPERLRGLYEL
jgi:hypothetical protein